MSKATEQAKEFLRQYAMQRGLDPEVVYTIHTDVDAEPVQVTVSLLAALVEEAEAASLGGSAKEEGNR